MAKTAGDKSKTAGDKSTTPDTTAESLPPCQQQLRPFWEAFNKFSQVLREAHSSQGRSATDVQLDFSRRARDSHDAFLSAPADQKTSSWKNTQDLQVQYFEALQDIGKNSTLQATDAYRDYLKNVQAAWAQTDVSNLGAPALAAISNSLQLAAYYAYAAKAAG
jgi:hypothetical protein